MIQCISHYLCMLLGSEVNVEQILGEHMERRAEHQIEFSIEQFQQPDARYRGAPFWAWNNKLNIEQLVKQVSYFKKMGFGGYHIHCRVDYLVAQTIS